jgi:TRAP transporter TAXI family solute receptor
VILGLLLGVSALAGCRQETRHIRFGGGPTGGTFYRFAQGMAEIIAEGESGVSITVSHSGGSQANLTGVEKGEYDMALVYAGDAYLGAEGRLPGQKSTGQVRALARLYGASAQLIVAASSPVRSPFDLKGKRVAIGSPGSGAALSAERFFRAIGLWESIIPVHFGYTMAMQDLSRGAVQAVWEMVGVPSASLRRESRRMHVRLLDLEEAARNGGLFEQYPFYRPAVIAAGTYPRQHRDVRTFQDAALWVARPDVDENLVYRGLTRLFGKRGRAKMRRVHPAGADLDPAKGLDGVKIPLHPEAERFWMERGLLRSRQ